MCVHKAVHIALEKSNKCFVGENSQLFNVAELKTGLTDPVLEVSFVATSCVGLRTCPPQMVFTHPPTPVGWGRALGENGEIHELR